MDCMRVLEKKADKYNLIWQIDRQKCKFGFNWEENA